MASFGPITANWGGNVAGLPKPGAVPKPPSGIAAAGTGLLKGLAPAKPKPVKLATGISAAGSAATNLAGQLTQGGPTAAATGGGNAPSPASTTGGASGPSDLDSTAMYNIANYLTKTNNSIAADQLGQTNDQVALQSALGQLAYNQPRDALSLEQKANAGGGLYSSVEQQNQGNLAQKFLTEQNADSTKYNNDIQGLASKIAALQASIPAYNQGQALDSATREATLAANNPNLGTPTPAATNPLMTPVPGATPLQQWQQVAQILGAPKPTKAPGPQKKGK